MNTEMADLIITIVLIAPKYPKKSHCTFKYDLKTQIITFDIKKIKKYSIFLKETSFKIFQILHKLEKSRKTSRAVKLNKLCP